MSDSITNFLTFIRSVLDFAPDWLVSVILIALSVALALGVHHLALAILQRVPRTDHPYLIRIADGTQGPSRLALVLLALAITIPTAPLDPHAAWLLRRLLLLAGIALIGWICIAALHLAADLYLLQFRIDVADNLLARKHITQIRILRRAVDTLVVVITIGFMLMTFESVREYGLSLFASAGVAGLAVGLALRPLLTNLLAGVQLAMTQPIRIEDAVIVENEYGWIEEITSTYVVVRLWDLRRLIVPLTYFIEKPFQNWTRETSGMLGTVLLYLDYRAPVDAIRDQAKKIAQASPNWDGRTCGVQVTDAKNSTIEVRVLVSSPDPGMAFDLRCEIREKLIAFLQREHPQALPRQRNESVDAGRTSAVLDWPHSEKTDSSAGG